jgi:hypothetical protein
MKTLLNPRLFVVMLVLCLAGCSSDNKGKIEGTKWASQATTVKGTTLPAGALRFEFGTDGKMKYHIGPQTLTGTYSLGTGSSVTFTLDQAIEGRKTHLQKITISGKQMTMKDTDGTSLTFDKVESGN